MLVRREAGKWLVWRIFTREYFLRLQVVLRGVDVMGSWWWMGIRLQSRGRIEFC